MADATKLTHPAHAPKHDSAKADLEKEIHSLKVKLGKAEKKVADLEAAADAVATGPFALPPPEDRVFGPDAVPLEQR